MVYDAQRPELFMKDAGCGARSAPGGRSGSAPTRRWNVPEPEIGIVLGTNGASRATRSATTSRRATSRAPTRSTSRRRRSTPARARSGRPCSCRRRPSRQFHLTLRVTDEWGASSSRARRPPRRCGARSPSSSTGSLSDNPVPPGSILLTGTGLVPPDSFTLLPGHFVEIHVPEIGTLVNPVVRASELIEKEPVQ